MIRLCSVWGAASLIACVAASCTAQGGGADNDRLVGAWKLVSLEQPRPDGKTSRIECCGMFVFTQDGHASVQVMQPATQGPAGAETANRYSQGGYEASYGTYVVNEKDHTFVLHVEGALARDLIGKDLPRHFEFAGNRLIVRSAQPDEHWRVVWERY